MYNSIVCPQSSSLVQMHEREEVTPCTSSRKRRYRSSFRFSTMKELKQARESKKKAVGINVQKILTFPEMNQEMGSIEGNLIWDGIFEIEEEKDGEDKPRNIIMVSILSSRTLFSDIYCRLIGVCLIRWIWTFWIALPSSQLCCMDQV